MASIGSEKLHIPVSSMERGISTFTFRTIFTDLSNGEGCRFPYEMGIEAKVILVQDDFLIELKVEGEGEFVCDSCGTEFRMNIIGKVQTLFTFDMEKAGGEEYGEIRFLPPTSLEIDISRDAQDALLLAVPTRFLCHDGCLGLCSRCGADLNKESCSCSSDGIDPRWEALKGISFED